jgi:hypothetical protein
MTFPFECGQIARCRWIDDSYKCGRELALFGKVETEGIGSRRNRNTGVEGIKIRINYPTPTDAQFHYSTSLLGENRPQVRGFKPFYVRSLLTGLR